MARNLALCLVLAGLVSAQKPGNSTDNYPELTTYRCNKADGCTEATNYLVLDSGSRTHATNGGGSCVCSTVEACATQCQMSAISNYSSVGVATANASVQLDMFVDGSEVSPRLYLLAEGKKNYEMVHFTGNEFAFDIDASKLPCGMNSALYLSEMIESGGRNSYNPGGASWGTGYCDAQCGVSQFLNGVGNVNEEGACCNEMDIWEANSRSTQIAPHPCNESSSFGCTGAACGLDGANTGVCDKDGCTWNAYHLNQTDFYGAGAGFRVDTTRPFTVVTQFPADSTTGNLSEIHRLYVQDGQVVDSQVAKVAGVPEVNYEDAEYCSDTGATQFMALGGLDTIGAAMSRGMVLVFSLWWDAGAGMAWLDTTEDTAGPCNSTEGFPDVITQVQPNPQVIFSNLKWGEINSTYSAS
ncbi:cellulase [Xylariaceae sp. FL0804]|nr:cellulase [Xylariaceae sp. FL0804]